MADRRLAGSAHRDLRFNKYHIDTRAKIARGDGGSQNAKWIIDSGTNTDLTKTNSTDREFAAHQLWGYYSISLNAQLNLPPPRCDSLAAPRHGMAI
jgi:hypothetical protein